LATLLAVPNFAEGRDQAVIERLTAAVASVEGARLLDRHVDPDHNRSVFTLAGRPLPLVEAVMRGAELARDLIDVIDPPAGHGVHPLVGALDVAPFVHHMAGLEGQACAAALVAADRLGSAVGIPVFLYGELAGGRRPAELRRGGPLGLADRLKRGELHPEFGPTRAHPRAGCTLVAARPPLVAFNCILARGTTLARAREVAALLREGGAEGHAGLRALAMELGRRGRVILSFNVERPERLPLARVVEAVSRHLEVERCELVGLAPEAALTGFPLGLFERFDPDRQVLERALAALASD